MGSADCKRSRVAKTEKLVSVRTVDLKDRLNRIYKCKHSSQSSRSDASRFDYLWDLKELALLEGRQSVDVPDKWLDEMESEAQPNSAHTGH